MTPKKLSVIITVYNGESTIRACLDSLHPIPAETEIICINDGSADNTRQILDAYVRSFPEIKVVHKRNGGVSSARNEGLKRATGEWISFIDGDDFLEKGALSAILEMLDKPVQLICWGAKISSAQNVPWLEAARRYHALKQTGTVAADVTSLSRNTVTLWNKAFRREILQQKQISFPEGILFEDNFFYWSYAPWVKDIYFSDKYLYNYIQSENSIMGRWNSGEVPYAMDVLAVFCKVCSYYQKHGLAKTHADYLHYLFGGCLLRALEKRDKLSVLEAFRTELKKLKLQSLSPAMKVVLNRQYRYVFSGKVLCGWERIFAVTNLGNKKVVFLFGFPVIRFTRRKK